MLEKIVAYATKVKLSDIHIHSDEPIAIRMHGDIHIQKEDFITKDMVEHFINLILDEHQKAHFPNKSPCDLRSFC